MRNFLKRALPTALLFLVVLAPLAHAGQWVTKEIFWQKTSVGSPYSGTAVYTRDTTYNVVAAGQTDTTGWFSLSNAAVWRRHDGAATTVDTCVVGYLVLQSDSLGVAATTLSSLTIEIDGRAGGYKGNTLLSGWQQVDSTVTTQLVNPAGSCFAAPIRAIGGLGTPDGNINFYYLINAYDNLRIRLTAAAGVLSAARAFIRYWDDGL